MTSNRLGDAVLSTGVLSRLIADHPDARVTVACGPLPAPLFRAVPGLDRVIAMPKRRWAGHWLRLWRETVGTRWDLVVDLRDGPIAWLLSARRRIVRRTPRRSRATLIHKVVENASVLGMEPPAAPTLWLDERARGEAQTAIPDGAPVLALAPTATWAGKTWRAENYVGLIDRLTGGDGLLPGARVAVVAGPDERDKASPVLDAVPVDRRIDLIGRLDPLAISAALARARLFVGNDSGVMHLAAAVGTPTLGLFGPGYPEVYGPWGCHAAVVTGAIPRDRLIDYPGFDHRTADESLMDSIAVEAVVEAARHLLARLPAEAA